MNLHNSNKSYAFNFSDNEMTESHLNDVMTYIKKKGYPKEAVFLDFDRANVIEKNAFSRMQELVDDLYQHKLKFVVSGTSPFVQAIEKMPWSFKISSLLVSHHLSRRIDLPKETLDKYLKEVISESITSVLQDMLLVKVDVDYSNIGAVNFSQDSIHAKLSIKINDESYMAVFSYNLPVYLKLASKVFYDEYTHLTEEIADWPSELANMSFNRIKQLNEQSGFKFVIEIPKMISLQEAEDYLKNMDGISHFVFELDSIGPFSLKIGLTKL